MNCLLFWWAWIAVLAFLPGVLRKPSSSAVYRKREALARRTVAFFCGCLSAVLISYTVGAISAYGFYLIRCGEWGGYGLLALANAPGLAASSTAALVILRRPTLTLAHLLKGFVLPLVVGAVFFIPLDHYCHNRFRDRLAADRGHRIGAAHATRATHPSAASAPAASQPVDNRNQ